LFVAALALGTVSCGKADAKPEVQAFTCGEIFGTGNITLLLDEAQGVLSTASTSGWNPPIEARFSPAIVHAVEHEDGDTGALVYTFDRIGKVLSVQTVDCAGECPGLDDDWRRGKELNLPDPDEEELAVHCFTEDDVSEARKR